MASKICSECGHANHSLMLSDRQWACIGCGALHNRDWHAAKNILQEGLRTFRNPSNVRFEQACKAAELFGFRFRGRKGSHRIFVRRGIREMLNFQSVRGKAKSYQVRQFIRIIEKYNLLEE
ncbi:transposase [Dehalococcoidia bacterium]|nr:transposase [Dehalococcoidia bacterium]